MLCVNNFSRKARQIFRTAEVPPNGGGVREQCDRLMGEAALLFPGYECNYLLIVAPSSFDRLVSGYRLI